MMLLFVKILNIFCLIYRQVVSLQKCHQHTLSVIPGKLINDVIVWGITESFWSYLSMLPTYTKQQCQMIELDVAPVAPYLLISTHRRYRVACGSPAAMKPHWITAIWPIVYEHSFIVLFVLPPPPPPPPWTMWYINPYSSILHHCLLGEIVRFLHCLWNNPKQCE